MEKALFSWSGGKDSAMALYALLEANHFEVASLLTTLNSKFDRISMHGVRRILLEQQASSLGFPLEEVFIPPDITCQGYELKMREVLEKFQSQGVDFVVFGDIFLEDLKKFREQQLSRAKMKGIFPVWGQNTRELALEFIRLGFKAVVTCVDSKSLDPKFVGRTVDKKFLSDLPDSVDPCGENGEFHSFVFDGPLFSFPIRFKKGEIVLRNEQFYYQELVPARKDVQRKRELLKNHSHHYFSCR